MHWKSQSACATAEDAPTSPRPASPSVRIMVLFIIATCKASVPGEPPQPGQITYYYSDICLLHGRRWRRRRNRESTRGAVDVPLPRRIRHWPGTIGNVARSNSPEPLLGCRVELKPRIELP